MGERRNGIAEVDGSIPSGSTTQRSQMKKKSKGSRSSEVERRLDTAKVTGSTPVANTKICSIGCCETPYDDVMTVRIREGHIADICKKHQEYLFAPPRREPKNYGLKPKYSGDPDSYRESREELERDKER
jgi:hypothetical protein